jgi:TolB-like protein/class 3 adenylate cyclase/Tfp pilus assembly protein PilF
VAEERVQRRLAAILAADVVGFSRLMGEDEEGTLAALTSHRKDLIEPTIAEFGGRVVKLMGDGILAEFASAVDAVTCAMAIQTAMASRNAAIAAENQILFRMGINVGDIIVDGDDIYGDGVNVAARLEGLAETGGVCISRAARDQIRDKLDYGLEDMGEIEVKNIARPVRAFRVLQDGRAASSPKSVAGNRSWITVSAALLVIALFSGGGLWWWQPWVERVAPTRPHRIAVPLPDKPSIAILPFANLSGDRQQDYFADGFTEDLITNAAQSKELFVIAHNSTFSYKGREVKIRQVAEELGVRYVLEGSVRRIGETVRITAQLIDATNGSHVWAKRYDEPTDRLFDVQDEVSREIASTLLVNVKKADLAKATQKRPKELSAYDYVLRARARWAAPGKKAKLEARALAQQAIAIDPAYAPAYAVLGDTYNSAYITQWGGPDALDRAYDAARKAVELDPSLSTAHELLGRVFLRRRQHDDAVAAIERSISLNPNQPRHYASLADTLTFANRAKEAVDFLRKANRLDPFYPPRQNMYLGRAYYFARQFDKAVAQLRICAARAPKWRPCYMFLAPAYAELGRQADAKRTLETLLKIAPRFSISESVQKHLPFVPSAMGFYIDGLRKAGVPEHPPLKLPEKPSIAVLPFTNMSDDKQQAYFSAGITEDITTDLSKVAGLLVTPSSATHRYSARDIDRRVIARELGVRHILEGGVRRIGDRLRITAKLIDAVTGVQVWAERYDREQKDVFAIQDDIADRVVAELSRRLKAKGLNRVTRVYTPNLEAYDLYIQGRAKRIPPSPSNLASALKMFEKAIELDPGFAGGYAGAAYVHVLKYGTSLVGTNPSDDLEAALRLAEKAVTLDPTFGPAWGSLSEAYSRKGRYGDALQAIEKAMKAAPNDSLMRATYGRLLGHIGRAPEGIEQVKQAMRMSPDSLPMLYFLGANYRVAGKFDDAIKALTEHRKRLGGRIIPSPTMQLIATYVQAGQLEKARAEARALLKVAPRFSVAVAVRTHSYKSDDDRNRFVGALRQAGIPE